MPINLGTKTLLIYHLEQHTIPGFPALGQDKSLVQTSILLSRNIYTISFTDFKCLVCAGIQTVVAPLVVIAKFYETLSQDQFELCQQDWKNDWIGKVVSFAFAWYIFVQFLVAMRNATDEQNAASYLIFPQENNRQCPWYSIHLGLCHQFDFGMLYSVGVSVFNVLDVG
jgi:hypothetical protein